MPNGIWSKLEERHAINKANRDQRDNNSSLLYQALMAGNNGTNNNSFSSNVEQASEGFDGFNNLAKMLKTNNTNSSTGLGTIGNASSSFISGSGSSTLPTSLGGASSGSAITDAITGVGGSGSAITDAINSSAGSGTTSNAGGLFSKLKGGSSGGGTPWALIGQVAKTGYNTISGHDDKEYSDLEESIIYPLQGAATGSMFGPWGAAGGALYGLGYSFKDDLGMKDSNFLTQMLFPIGMGDGGGLRIGGKPILDLG